MENAMKMEDAIKKKKDSSGVAAVQRLPRPQPVSERSNRDEELFSEQEWAALLHSFEPPPAAGEGSAAAAPAPERALSSDELWERLARTGWVRESARDVSSDSTVAIRPK